MNRLATCLAALAITIASFGKDVSSKISHVTVYPKGATVVRDASTSLSKGQNTLRFYGISNSINTSSIQLEAKGDYIVQSIAYRYDFLKPVVANPKIKVLEDSVKIIGNKRGENNAVKAAYEEEMAFIQANRTIGNQQVASQASEFEKMAQIIRTRVKEIRLALHKHNLIEYAYVADINRINRQIQELRGFSPQRTGIIEIKLIAEKAISGTFNLSYFVNNAGWRPTYDLRFTEVDQPIQMKYNALVQQNTGIEWKSAKLTLSTSTPHMSNALPVLHPWQLYYKQPANYSLKNTTVLESYSYEEKKQKADFGGSGLRNAQLSGNFTTVSESMVAIDFDIDLPYTIESDGKDNLINLKKENIDASYNYYAAPKIEKEAFLVAHVTDWYKLNLLPGTSNLFIGNRFMGQSYLNPAITNDTLDIGFGRDKMVQIQRTLINRECKKGMVAGKQRHLLEYEIAVRNLHRQAIDITIEDQIPISSIKEIEVEMKEKSGADYDEKTGLLTWELNIPSGESEKKEFGFTVKHPRNKVVYPLNNVN